MRVRETEIRGESIGREREREIVRVRELPFLVTMARCGSGQCKRQKFGPSSLCRVTGTQ